MELSTIAWLTAAMGHYFVLEEVKVFIGRCGQEHTSILVVGSLEYCSIHRHSVPFPDTCDR
jgi:hypothetical protein